MKQVLLDDVPTYQAMEIEELVSEYRQLEVMKKELEARMSAAKEEITNHLEKRENQEFKNGKYEVYLKNVTSQRIDSQWVKNFIKEQKAEPKMMEVKSQRLNIKRID